MKVTKESIIGDVLDYNAGTAKYFFEIGMHCLGCPASRGESIADEHPEIVVGKVNVDQENAFAMRFGIVSIPFVALIKNGEVVARSLGYRQKDELLSVLGL